jgi:HNH endonuclease
LYTSKNKLCKCGCEKAVVSAKSEYITGHNRKGKKFTPESRLKCSIARLGNKNRWKGGRYIDDDGYVLIFKSTHPFRNKCGYVYEHRLVMEEHLGYLILPCQLVHHINRNKQDNRIENLQLIKKFEHNKYHRPFKPIGHYVSIYKPEHPNAMIDGYILEHRFIMSEFLGRPLTKEEIVHHKNNIRNDNRIENLELFSSVGEHISTHWQ